MEQARQEKKYLEQYTVEERREMWPPAQSLQIKHIHNCRLIEDRYKLLDLMPKNAICTEVGILYCDFSAEILKRTNPSRLHLIDIQARYTKIAEDRFSDEISRGIVQTHLGDSHEMLLSFPDKYFDWIYIDGNHGYPFVKKDLEASRAKIKDGGLIVMNDYIYFGTSDFMKYGVIEATNEFCIEHDYEILYLALQGRMYNDVVIRKII